LSKEKVVIVHLFGVHRVIEGVTCIPSCISIAAIFIMAAAVVVTVAVILDTSFIDC
jgi:hypothetical protein